MCILAHAGEYTVGFFKTTYIHYKLRKTNSIMVIKPKRENKTNIQREKQTSFLAESKITSRLQRSDFFFFF